MTPRHSTRVRRALSEMPEHDPAIAALALWCQHRDHDGPTATAGDTILYGPCFEDLSLPEQIGVTAHHVLHVSLRHSARSAEMAARLGRSFRPWVFNLASDAIVNEALLLGGHALPRPAVRASELIALLPDPAAAPSAILSDWDTDRLYHALTQPLAGDPSQVQPRVEDYASKRRFRPDLEAEGHHEAQSDLWATRMQQALELGRAAGTGIGPALAHFSDLPHARTPWEIHLRRLLARAAQDQPRQSYNRPASRWTAQDAEARSAGILEPAFQPGRSSRLERPRIVIALDTSSSVRKDQLDLLASEALGIRRRSTAELHLLGFDTEVHSRTRLDHPQDFDRLDMRRGGGTDFTPVMEEARKLGPSLLVLLTDLDAPTGPAPGYPVVWAVPAPVRHAPAFGKLLVMDR